MLQLDFGLAVKSQSSELVVGPGASRADRRMLIADMQVVACCS